MAFELIFGKSTRPGSWKVCESLLALNTTDDLEAFRERIKQEAEKRFPPRGTKRQLTKLESTRDGAYYVFNKYEVAFEKCLEIAKFTNTFTEDNLIVAICALNELKRTEEALVYSFMFEHYYHYQSNEVPSFEELFAACYDMEMDETEVTDRLIGASEKWLSVDKKTPIEKRLLYLCDVVFFMIFKKPSTPTSQFLANEIEKNAFLLRQFQSPFNLVALNVFERFEISLLHDVVRHSLTEQKKEWQVTFIDNLAKAFVSTETLAFLLAKGGGWNLCENFKAFCKFHFSCFQPSTYAFEDSVTWMCNAAAAVILFGYGTSDRERLERTMVSVPYPLMLCKNEIDWPNDCEVLLKLLDLLIFLGVASRADWFMRMINLPAREKIDPDNKFCTRKVYTAFATTKVSHNLQIQVIKKLRSMTNVCEHLQSYIAQFASRLKFTSDNMSLLKVKSIRSNMWLVILPLALLFDVNDPIAETPQLLAPVLSDKRLGQMLLGGFTNLMTWPLKIPCSSQLVDLMASLCSARPSHLIRDLLENDRWQAAFFVKRVTAQWEGPRLLALVIRNADNSLRKKWSDRFGDQLLHFAVIYFSTFIIRYDTPIRVRLNQLLVIHGFIRPYPIVPLAKILKALEDLGYRQETALKMFVSNLMPTEPSGFVNAPHTQLVGFKKRFRSIGQVVAGLVYETVIGEVTKADGIAAAHKLANLYKPGQKALIAKMKRQLASFN